MPPGRTAAASTRAFRSVHCSRPGRTASRTARLSRLTRSNGFPSTKRTGLEIAPIRSVAGESPATRSCSVTGGAPWGKNSSCQASVWLAPLPPDSSRLFTVAMPSSAGARARSSSDSKRKRCVTPPSSTRTDSGSMRAVPPTWPATAARRSCVITPTSRPRTPSLKEEATLGTTVVISAVESGSRTSPDWKNGWPNSSTRSPSRQVSVPIADISRSPRSTSTATAEPGTRASGPGPPPSARPPGTTARPKGVSARVAGSSIAGLKPAQASGRASGCGPADATGGGGGAGASSSSQRSSRKRGAAAAPASSMPLGPALPPTPAVVG